MAPGMNAPLYTTEILRLAASLEPPRALGREDGRAELRSRTCGSIVTSMVELDGGRIAALSQQVHACAFGQASAALLERGAVGREASEVRDAHDALAGWLVGAGAEPSWPGIAALAPARSHKSRHAAILLPFRALIAAIEAADA
jgi:NifU-like protein involved in Fe-S cluster formation